MSRGGAHVFLSAEVRPHLYRERRHPGGMAEWFMAIVLKTIECKLRGFESLSLRFFAERRFSGDACCSPNQAMTYLGECVSLR